MNPNTQLSTVTTRPESTALSMLQSVEIFELVQRQAEYISKSDMIPKEYRGKPENCAIAIEIASRLGASYFMIMQSMDVIHGRPSWRAQFLIGMVNSCGRFGPLQFDIQVTGPEKTVPIEYTEKEGFGPSAKSVVRKINYTYVPTTCFAYATSRLTGEVIKGPPVSYDMAIEEGWVAKAGSKWLTPMRELMLTYRAGSFFSRIHASDLTLGMHTTEEARDMGPFIEVEATTVDDRQQAPAGNPYKALPETKAEPAKKTRGSAKDAAPAPAKEEPAAAPADSSQPARGIRVFYEKIDVQHSPPNASKTWTKYTLHYSVPGGAVKQASTFSDTIITPLENADEGTAIAIETTPNPNPKYADTLTFLQVLDEAQEPTKPSGEEPPWE